MINKGDIKDLTLILIVIGVVVGRNRAYALCMVNLDIRMILLVVLLAGLITINLTVYCALWLMMCMYE